MTQYEVTYTLTTGHEKTITMSSHLDRVSEFRDSHLEQFITEGFSIFPMGPGEELCLRKEHVIIVNIRKVGYKR